MPSPVRGYLSIHHEDLRTLSEDAPEWRARGRGLWYVPDPSMSSDPEKVREKALLK